MGAKYNIKRRAFLCLLERVGPWSWREPWYIRGMKWIVVLLEMARRTALLAQSRNLDVSDQPHISRARVFSRALTDKELRDLTS